MIKPLFGAEEIGSRVTALAQAIAAVEWHDPLVVPLLKGSFIFAADLLRALHAVGFSPETDFMLVASYGTGMTSSGEVRLASDLACNVSGRDVLLVDDILDSGRTLAFARTFLLRSGARSVKTCVLIDKEAARAAPVAADFVGFACGPVFLVGYGMDLAHRYRELPFIGVIEGDGEVEIGDERSRQAPSPLP